MDHQKAKHVRRLRRKRHVRKKLQGTPARPRLTVFRSSKHICAQLVDDLSGATLAEASSLSPALRAGLPVSKNSQTYGGNVKAAVLVGKALAEKAKEKGITKVAFDRGHYRYHGRVKALADAAREGGLSF